MRKTSYKFQTKDYAFPKSFYVACIKLTSINGKRESVCLSRVFDNLHILRRYILFVINDIRKTGYFDASFRGSYIKADFNRLLPLKKEYWNKKGRIKIELYDNFRSHANILKFWKMSEILITPDGQIDGAEYFSLCAAFFKNTSSRDVDLYIRNSNLAVDTNAKNAAFYTINKPVKINWLEKREVQTEEKLSLIYKN